MLYMFKWFWTTGIFSLGAPVTCLIEVKTAIKRNRPYVTHGYSRCFLKHMFKKALQISFCRTVWNCLFRALHVLRESKTLVNACKLPCFPASTQGFLVPGLLTPTSIFGMNQRDARRLDVRGEIVYSGLYLRVFRTESQIFYTLKYRLGLWIQSTMCWHVEMADSSSTQDACKT